MWVDVVCLRRDGLKLSQDELRAVTPTRAQLTMDTVVLRTQADADPPRRADVAQLWSDAGRPLGALECARVSRVGGAGLLVVGVDANGASHPQAWWCRVVLAEDDGVPREVSPEWRETWPGSVPTPITDSVPLAATAHAAG